MTIEEKFNRVEYFNSLLDEGRKTGNIRFKDVEEKLELGKIYASIYVGVKPNLSCDSCVRFYMEQLAAWYQREYRKWYESMMPEDYNVGEIEAIIEEDKLSILNADTGLQSSTDTNIQNPENPSNKAQENQKLNGKDQSRTTGRKGGKTNSKKKNKSRH